MSGAVEGPGTGGVDRSRGVERIDEDGAAGAASAETLAQSLEGFLPTRARSTGFGASLLETQLQSRLPAGNVGDAGTIEAGSKKKVSSDEVKAWLDHVPDDPARPLQEKDKKFLEALSKMSEEERDKLLRALSRGKLEWVLAASGTVLPLGNPVGGTIRKIFKQIEEINDVLKITAERIEKSVKFAAEMAAAKKDLEAGKVPDGNADATRQVLKEMDREELSKLCDKLAGSPPLAPDKLAELIRIAAGSDDPEFKARLLQVLGEKLDKLTAVMEKKPSNWDFLPGGGDDLARTILVNQIALSARETLSDATAELLAHETGETIDLLKGKDPHGRALKSLFEALGEPEKRSRTDKMATILGHLQLGEPPDGKTPIDRLKEGDNAARLGYAVGALQAGLEKSASDMAHRAEVCTDLFDFYASIGGEFPGGGVLGDRLAKEARERLKAIAEEVRAGRMRLADALEELVWPRAPDGSRWDPANDDTVGGTAVTNYKAACSYVVDDKNWRG